MYVCVCFPPVLGILLLPPTKYIVQIQLLEKNVFITSIVSNVMLQKILILSPNNCMAIPKYLFLFS